MDERGKEIWRKFIVLAVLSIVFLASISCAPRSGTFTLYTASDGRPYKVFVPSGYQDKTPVPMIVMLHGCRQDPDKFAYVIKMNGLAEKETFLVVYPEQTLFGQCVMLLELVSAGKSGQGDGRDRLPYARLTLQPPGTHGKRRSCPTPGDGENHAGGWRHLLCTTTGAAFGGATGKRNLIVKQAG